MIQVITAATDANAAADAATPFEIDGWTLRLNKLGPQSEPIYTTQSCQFYRRT